jgi:hypothetical protein
LEQGRKFGDGSGILFIGDQGKILCNTFGENARLIPEKKMKAYKLPSKSLKRSPGIYQGWIRACKGGDPPCSNFNISGPLTETVLLGNIALRIPKRKLEWDGSNLKFKNSNQANQYLQGTLRHE